MPKTKLVISTAPTEKSANTKEDVESSSVNDDIDWKKYAQLLRKENHKQEKKIKLYQTGKRKPIKRISVGPPSQKQVESRGEFKKRVSEAQALYQGGASGRKWKDCMSQVYREARERKEKKEHLENL